jgi:hypothetical protein
VECPPKFPKGHESRTGWPSAEFCSRCFNILGDDLLKTVEYSRISGQILAPFNATFIALIPKTDNPHSFDQFKPISLCNNIYKIVYKLIALIFVEQSSYLQGRHIHQAIGLVQEGLHSIHIGKQKAITYKVDLAKDFD